MLVVNVKMKRSEQQQHQKNCYTLAKTPTKPSSPCKKGYSQGHKRPYEVRFKFITFFVFFLLGLVKATKTSLKNK